MEEDPLKVPEMPQEDHADFRARFVDAHPDVILIDAREPHRKFVERLNRDFLAHGMAPFYELAGIRTRADTIVQRSGLTRNAEDLLIISKADEPDQVTDMSHVFHRLHAFVMSLEFLNVCEYSVKAGALQYLQELEQFRIKCPGLPFVLAADTAIRKKVYRLQSEKRVEFPSFSLAMLEVLRRHKYLWNDARAKAIATHADKARSQGAAPDRVLEAPTGASPRAQKRKRQKERAKEANKKQALALRRPPSDRPLSSLKSTRTSASQRQSGGRSSTLQPRSRVASDVITTTRPWGAPWVPSAGLLTSAWCAAAITL